MSWDAHLETTETRNCPHCGGVLEQTPQQLGWWNYTHNTNSMIFAAYEAVTGEIIGRPWWKLLNGQSGTEGAVYLGQIIEGLEADPGRHRLANPPNGWGDYDGLLGVLREMRDAVPDEPTVWRVSG